MIELISIKSVFIFITKLKIFRVGEISFCCKPQIHKKNSFWPEKKISVKNVFQFRLHNNSDTKVFLNKQTIFTKKYSSWKSSIMFTTTISQCIWVFFYFLFTFIIISELFWSRSDNCNFASQFFFGHNTLEFLSQYWLD